jgi:hypothetical protein
VCSGTCNDKFKTLYFHKLHSPAGGAVNILRPSAVTALSIILSNRSDRFLQKIQLAATRSVKLRICNSVPHDNREARSETSGLPTHMKFLLSLFFTFCYMYSCLLFPALFSSGFPDECVLMPHTRHDFFSLHCVMTSSHFSFGVIQLM